MLPDLSSVYSQEQPAGDKGSNNDLQLHLTNNLIPSIANSPELREFLSKISNRSWLDKMFVNSTAYYHSDPLLWGPFLIIIFKDPDNSNISTVTIDKLGLTSFPKVDISKSSKYYPAIENLSQQDQNSNVKKAMAACLLEKYTQLNEDQIKLIAPQYPLKFEYDQVYAGELASRCQLFTHLSSEKLGEKLLQCGIFSSTKVIKSTLLDVVYENNESYIDSNNKLVFHLGEQLEQLFNPITEYSPEQTEYNYKQPTDESFIEEDGPLVKAIINELLQFQSNFTFNLVEFLQKVLITLRVRVLNDEIEGLSTVKLNRLFPPTIDEVTRINCIFLDSLKAAVPYGSLEILKACSLTIPYFYKAYTRHEAATKNFSKDIKLFLRNFHDILPEKDLYTELKIETIIKGPQEKLIKLKLIIDRLWNNKKSWSSTTNQSLAKKEFTNIIDVIDSFGKLDKPLSSYNTRVFTPSGKILTELAKGWPVELQYKWLKRRVVGVYDIIDTAKSNNRNVLVIFSDYIVFLSIMDFEKYYTTDGSNKPLISDILMNSLINEVPLPPKIPKLKVEKYSYIDKIFVSVFDEEYLRFDAIKGDESFSITCQLANPKSVSVTYISDLITKAKILEKDTAFHLFKAYENDVTLYSTAHELEAYNNERIKSPFALFLNIEPSSNLLAINNLQLAIFVKFIKETSNEEIIQFNIISSQHSEKKIELPSDEIIRKILENISLLTSSYYSSTDSPLIADLMNCNICLLREIQTIDDEILLPISDNSSQKLIIQQVNSENKQSYGTITTFRSITSDLKDNNEEKPTIEIKDHTKKTSTPVKMKQKIQKPITKKQKSPLVKKDIKPLKVKEAKNINVKTKEKKGGFFGIFKNMFGSSKKKTKKATISKPIAVTDQRRKDKKHQNTNSIPTPTSMKKIQLPVDGNRLSRINLAPALEKINTKDKEKKKEPEPTSASSQNSDNDSVSQLRISSVVRNTDFSKKTNIPPEIIEENSKPEVDVISNPEASDAQEPAIENRPVVDEGLLNQKNEVNEESIHEPVSSEVDNTEEQSKIKVMAQDIASPVQHSIIEQPELSLSEEDNTEFSHSTIQTRDIVNKGIIGNINTQSQVFNNDLFGDFIEDIPTVRRKQHKDKQHKDNHEPSSISVHSNSFDENGDVLSVDRTPVPRRIISTDSSVTLEKEPIVKEEETNDIDGNSTEQSIPKNDDISIQEKKEMLEEIPHKFQAFPELPHIPLPKVHTSFGRSPSFIELFQGMRMVLDNNDAKYNWKRIPSTTSLDENLKLDPSEKETKMESVPEEPSEVSDLHESITKQQNQSNEQKSPLNYEVDHVDTVMVKKEVEDDSVSSENTYNLEKSVNKVVQGMFEEPSVNNLSSKSPSSFKVVNSSPSRYIEKSSIHSDRLEDHIINNTITHLDRPEPHFHLEKSPVNKLLANESNIASDFSFPSDINHGPDKRWLELSFTSQEDFRNNKNQSVESLDNHEYATPYEEVQDKFLDTKSSVITMSDANRDSTVDNTTPMTSSFHNDAEKTNDTTVQTNDSVRINVNGNIPVESSNTENSRKTIKSSNKANNQEPDNGEANKLLDDLEFSSFNMTFDSTNNNETQDLTNGNILPQISEVDGEKSMASNLWNNIPNLQSKDNGPVVYRLSRDLLSESSPNDEEKSQDSKKLSVSGNEDDPIWVSPSKLNFSISPAKSMKGATTKYTGRESSNDNNGINDDTKPKSNLIEDSSFAFLADIVNNNDSEMKIDYYDDNNEIESEDDVDYKNDKPERLKFVK